MKVIYDFVLTLSNIWMSGGCVSKVSQCSISVRNEKIYGYISMDYIQLV